ncbi:Capsule biosynthesis protein CapA [Paraliobacillus sp. PM-2]|uniref:CapA family protein n=1 Tax=Paraliobacillus sp. PM-2 TaxID=1462524 RepID=UPI00061C2139|nr:CapA family protein [Paraliobacillus sp. PM-2]CQR48283.1 Capsule biosynthesis protein CapA [Paraliobacillus sp. PM-2]
MGKRIRLVIFIIFIGSLLLSCQKGKEQYETSYHAKRDGIDILLKEELDIMQRKRNVTLAAVGDILIHDRVYNDAKGTEGYHFMPMLEKVQPYLSQPTITTANQETMIGGEEIGLSSYPRFNSPVAVGDALKTVGVDIVSLANNHTLDRGEQAIQRAISHWNNINMPYVGSYHSQEDSEKVRVIHTEEDISLSFLGYTYGTNGIPTPDGKEYLVNRINRKAIAKDVKKAKKVSDVVVLNLHFGNQYERMPNEKQKDLVQYVADLGVDVVFGHHPHVLQPMEWIEGEKGNRTFVIYSLGNFLSGQDEFYRRIGGMVQLTIQKEWDKGKERITLHSPKFLPTFVDFTEESESDYQVIPMYQLTDEQLTDHEKHYKEMQQHLSQWMPELTFIEK